MDTTCLHETVLWDDRRPSEPEGFQVGDVIVRYNGEPVTNDVDLRDRVARTKPGDTVPVVVRRDGHETTLNVTVGSAPDLQAAESGNSNENAPAKPNKVTAKLGVRVANASDPDVRQELKLKGNPQGAVIVETVPGSPASEAGLQPGDILERLNGRTITNADQLSDIVSGIKGDSVNAVVRRGSQTMLVQINLD
jgi:serine protease Do